MVARDGGRRADHVKIKPRTPRLNGKVERSHRIDSDEFYQLLQGQVIDDANVFAEKLQEWEDYYNYHRPHGALNGQTPYERLRQKTQDPHDLRAASGNRTPDLRITSASLCQLS